MKKTNILFLLIFLSIQYVSVAQESKYDFDTRHYVGGYFGLSFGTVVNINLSPNYGFYVLPRLSIGVGGSYQYYNSVAYTPPTKLNIFGGSVFSRFDIIDALYVHGELEVLTYKTDMFSPIRQMEQIVSENVLIGAGYRQLFSYGEKSCIYIMLLFNLNDTFFTPYSNPVIRMGLEIHF